MNQQSTLDQSAAPTVPAAQSGPAARAVVPEGPPIFVVGTARSGTTLMQLMLSAHPRIYICFELSYYFWYDRGKRIEDIVRAAAKTGLGVYHGMDPEAILARLPSPLPRKYWWRVYDEIMKQKAAGLGRPRYGDKTPGHSQHLKQLFEDFPDARVIMMVRDPRAAALSLARMPWGCERDLANCVVNEQVRRKTKRYRGRVLEVRLEDLQRNPKLEMMRVLDFVGEDWDDAVLDHAAHNPDAVPVPPLPWLESSATPVQRSSERPWGNLSPVRLRAIEFLVKKSLKFYGYERAQIDGPEPGFFAVLRQILSDIPGSLRFDLAWLRLLFYLRKPEHWAYEDETYRRLYARVNPSCWQLYPDFRWPDPSEFEHLRAPAEAQAPAVR